MVIATYSDTPQREKLVDMAGPYMRTDEGILVTSSTHDITQLSDLEGKTVCTTTGSTTAAPGSPLTVPGAVGSLVQVSDISDCVKLLVEGNVQAVASDLLILYGYQETSNDLIVVPGIDIPETNEWMVGLQPGDQADCNRVVSILRSFLQSNWANEFEQWFPAVVHADPTWEIDYEPNLQQEPPRCI
jgi:glutamate transport system substrate-binding protein